MGPNGEGCAVIWFPFEGTGVMTGWEALKDGTSIGVVCILWRRRRRTAQKMISPPMIMIAIPPITPPTIDPTDTPDVEEDGVVVDVGTDSPVTSGWASSSNENTWSVELVPN